MVLSKIIDVGLSDLLLFSCSAPESVDQNQSVETETGESKPATESTEAAAGNYIMYEIYAAVETKHSNSKYRDF